METQICCEPLSGMQIFNLLLNDEAFVRWLLTLPLDEPRFDMDNATRCALAQFLNDLYCYRVFVCVVEIEFRDHLCSHLKFACPQWASEFQNCFLPTTSTVGLSLPLPPITPRQALCVLRGEEHIIHLLQEKQNG